MDELEEAVIDAATDILSGDQSDQVIVETAHHYGLHVELLRRKLEDRFGPATTLYARHGDAFERGRRMKASDAQLNQWLIGQIAEMVRAGK